MSQYVVYALALGLVVHFVGLGIALWELTLVQRQACALRQRFDDFIAPSDARELAKRVLDLESGQIETFSRLDRIEARQDLELKAERARHYTLITEMTRGIQHPLFELARHLGLDPNTMLPREPVVAPKEP